MSETIVLIGWSIFVWIVIISAIFVIYRKRNPLPTSQKFIQRIIIEDEDDHDNDDEDPRSISQLQVEKKRLLSSKRKVLLLQNHLQKSLRHEKSPASIALALALGTSRLKIQKITLEKNRLGLCEMDIQHINAELQRIHEIITKKFSQSHSQPQEEEVISTEDQKKTLFITYLEEELAKRSPRQFGFGLRPQEKILESFSFWEQGISGNEEDESLIDLLDETTPLSELEKFQIEMNQRRIP